MRSITLATRRSRIGKFLVGKLLHAALSFCGLSMGVLAGGTAFGQAPGSAPPAGTGGPEIRAQLSPRQYTTLSSEMAGRIDTIATKTGEHFQKGDVLVTFDCAIQRAQEARARSVLLRATKTYTSDQRLVALHSMGQLELEIAGADVQTAKADVAGAEVITSRCVIAAPFDGVTVEQKARAYQYTTPGQPLLDILDNKNLDVELIAPSRWLTWLKPGYAFSVHIDETDKTYPAHVTRLGGRVDPVSQSIKVIGEISGDAPDLMSGMSGRATFEPPK